jgi:hypothetical protein
MDDIDFTMELKRDDENETEEYLENDEISTIEAGFMKGYNAEKLSEDEYFEEEKEEE